MRNIPRIVIAGTQSGVGKTSLTLGLVAALRQRGLRVQTFKVGPDYLDPTYLALASGRPCYNLDGWMTSRAYVRGLFSRASRDADVAVVEGVMGLFDGADPTALDGSTAEIALWLDAPVVLVANAHGVSRSFAAAVHGFATFDPKIRIVGVIANSCGSDRHAQWLADGLKGAGLPPLLGAVKRGALPQLPSRHLGLVTADSERLSQNILGELSDAVAAGVSPENIMAAANAAMPFADTNDAIPVEKPAPFVRLGIARDEAFHFYYPDNLEALERAGCELVPFSPLRDRILPPGLHGLYIGGGYPEEHVAALADNGEMLQAIRQFASGGGVIYAECGGLMYLSRGIETLDGRRHSLLGLLPCSTRMCSRRKSLGYVEVTLTRNSLWGATGESLRGHEFHYSELAETPTWETAYGVRYRRSETVAAEGYQDGSLLASYAHLHFASRPGAIQNFIRRLSKS